MEHTNSGHSTPQSDGATQAHSAGIADTAPDYIRAISPYIPGKPVAELAREFGLDEKDIIKLASNENPLGPSPKALAAIARAAAELTRYPDGAGFELKAALGRRNNVDPRQIVLGNGSNDILEFAAHAFLRPGTSAIYARHSFAVYPLATQAFGATGIEVPAIEFGHDLDAMRDAICLDSGSETRIVWVANPNNPTGTWLPPAEVKAFIASVPRHVLVVLDEAYNEYLAPEQQANTAAWLAEFPNLLLSRTFSKAYGLAALRMGYGLMDASVAAMLERVRQPFNVNALAQAAALAALDDADYLRESYDKNRAGMAQLEQGFGKLELEFIPSHANFICVKVGDAAHVNLALLKRGIIVRPVANYSMPEYLRVTIGTTAENTRFLRALGDIVG